MTKLKLGNPNWLCQVTAMLDCSQLVNVFSKWQSFCYENNLCLAGEPSDESSYSDLETKTMDADDT